jgi:hypothetical protein
MSINAFIFLFMLQGLCVATLFCFCNGEVIFLFYVQYRIKYIDVISQRGNS